MKSQGFSWAGSPTNLQLEPFEYFYIRRTEYVTERVLDQKNGGLIKETCIKQSIQNAKQALLEKMISDSIPKANYDTPFRFIQEKNVFKDMDYEYEGKSPEILKCEPAAYSLEKIPDGEYEICECILYFHHKGGNKDIQKRFNMMWRLMDEKYWKEY